MWRTCDELKKFVTHSTYCLSMYYARFVTKSNFLKKTFFSAYGVGLLFLRSPFACLIVAKRRYSEGRAKEERTHPPTPPWWGAIFAYLKLLIFCIVKNIYKAYCQRLEGISKASRRNVDEKVGRIINKATVKMVSGTGTLVHRGSDEPVRVISSKLSLSVMKNGISGHFYPSKTGISQKNER